jgi:hypothetical protein
MHKPTTARETATRLITSKSVALYTKKQITSDKLETLYKLLKAVPTCMDKTFNESNIPDEAVELLKELDKDWVDVTDRLGELLDVVKKGKAKQSTSSKIVAAQNEINQIVYDYDVRTRYAIHVLAEFAKGDEDYRGLLSNIITFSMFKHNQEEAREEEIDAMIDAMTCTTVYEYFDALRNLPLDVYVLENLDIRLQKQRKHPRITGR